MSERATGPVNEHSAHHNGSDSSDLSGAESLEEQTNLDTWNELMGRTFCRRLRPRSVTNYINMICAISALSR